MSGFIFGGPLGSYFELFCGFEIIQSIQQLSVEHLQNFKL